MLVEHLPIISAELNSLKEKIWPTAHCQNWFLIKEAGKIVAFAGCSFLFGHAAHGFYCAYVDPDNRGKGYHSKLIQARLDFIKDAPAYVAIHRYNEPCLKNYRKFNFKEVPRIAEMTPGGDFLTLRRHNELT